jgi:hypothetical protein
MSGQSTWPRCSPKRWCRSGSHVARKTPEGASVVDYAEAQPSLSNIGKETLRAAAFLVAAMFTQNFDNEMMPPKSHILGTSNREG